VGGEAVEAAGVSGVEALEGVGVDDERELGQLRPKGCLGHGRTLRKPPYGLAEPFPIRVPAGSKHQKALERSVEQGRANGKVVITHD
jgi:hypothetical protein